MVLRFLLVLSFVGMCSGVAFAWSPMAADSDPLIRFPGTQPTAGTIPFVAPANSLDNGQCADCHFSKTDPARPSFQWQGSMMAQAARDPIFWATMTVAAQDSIWVMGRPNATDICLRCHFPEGWLNGDSTANSDNVDTSISGLNASQMVGSDYDGIHCDVCHRMYDPFFKDSAASARGETNWDEAGLGGVSAAAAAATYALDAGFASALTMTMFDGITPFFSNDAPAPANYVENGAGQMYVDTTSGFANKRGPFVDAATNGHTITYSRYHKSKYFCQTCHDVSNPVMANLGHETENPLPTEANSPNTYGHVERTFSEFMSSAYAADGGAATNPEFQTQGGTGITNAAMCQDCHMPDVNGAAAGGGVFRPTGSLEHQNGAPSHDLQGGNAWTTRILASTNQDSIYYDATNQSLLMQGPNVLTLDMTQGSNPTIADNANALEAAVARAESQLTRAGTLKNVVFDQGSGALSFQVLNNTGHKLLSGYPEGRRMFVNIKAYNAAGSLVYEVNPYDANAGTFKGGLSFWTYNGDDGNVAIPDPAPLTASEAFNDALVYEAVTKSTLTNEDHTFHFALATDRYKDNRIPPKGYDLAEAVTRLSEPVTPGGVKDTVGGQSNLYSAAELAGGYDDVSLTIPVPAQKVVLTLYYQGTSREYVEFLRDEINGSGANRALYGPDNIIGQSNQTYAQVAGLNTDLADNAYLAQTDPFFTNLAAWGDTIWQLWYHNHGLDGTGPQVGGIVPFQMHQATAGFSVASPNGGETLNGGDVVNIEWLDNPNATSYDIRLSYDGTKFWNVATGQTGTSYAWTVPDNNVSGAVVRVVARNAGGWVAADDSDAGFNVIKQGSVVFPNGGENVSGNSTQTVQWTANAGADSYDVRLSYDGVKFWTIASGLTGTSYSWSVPNHNVTNGKIRVVSRNTGAWIGADDSNQVFTITKQ